ncbi:DNA polymerase III subunit gamma/tau [Acidisphaera sp. L21]|uniref:DNA polymerase III subunit gamma/tau n=1 Tax=Acidisphaera sp. L21 TaxID=1641851 RepID=UPI00131CF71B|nr:DNA polymerase III subunit gamma/tau [Acidisphaera sp. L21]
MSGLFGDAPAEEAPPQAGAGLFGDTLPTTAATPYRVLARKYRPTRFEDLIGQDVMVRTLRNAFSLNRIAHAFMLTGVRGVGKTTTARIIARALNCIGPDGQGGPTATPCGICANCTAILADRHPDVIEMDAATRNKVDDAREIIEAVRYKPLQARTKVFILDEVHMLTTQAFNALLKTLEEPPPHIIFIFATTEIRKVPITVLSRCQRFDLRRISAAELASLFTRVATAETVAVAPAAMDLIARAADGSARDGLSLLDQAIARMEGAEVTAAEVTDMLGLADRQLVFDLMEAIAAGDVRTALDITDRAHAFGADLGTILTDLVELVHMLTRLRSVPELRDGLALPEAERTRGAALADRLSVPVLSRAWQMLLKGLTEVESAPDRRAAAEMVLIRLCHVADVPPPGDLVRRLTAEGTTTTALPLAPPQSGGGARAISSGGAMAARAPEPEALTAAPAPRLANFRDVVALCSGRDPTLHSHMRHSVHLVRFAPGIIELRPEPVAPRDLAPRLAALLLAESGTRWTIALSTALGEPTIGEQGDAAELTRRDTAAAHPLVLAILEAFPGATIGKVRDSAMDEYGLPATPMALGEPDMPDFAPPDAEPADMMED